MPLGYAVDVGAHIETEERHVESNRPSKHLQELEREQIAQHATDEVIGELIMPGRHRAYGL